MVIPYTSCCNCNTHIFILLPIWFKKPNCLGTQNHWLNLFFHIFDNFLRIPDNSSRMKNAKNQHFFSTGSVKMLEYSSYNSLETKNNCLEKNVFFGMIFLNLSKNSIFADILIIKKGQPSMPSTIKKYFMHHFCSMKEKI